MKTACILGFACSLLLAENALAGTGPRIFCDEPEYQFGEKPNTGVVEHVFIVENKGDAPLHVGSVRACCGTGASIATNQIGPQTNTTVAVSLSIGGMRGPVSKVFYIGSDDPAQPYCQLRVTGTATADAYLDPGSVNFGDLRSGEKAEQVVKLAVSTNIALSVTNVTIDVPKFAATFSKTKDGYGITVHTVPPFKPGVTQGNMRILTDNKAFPQFDMHLVATLGCDILVVPPDITLVTATGKAAPVTRYLAIRSKRGAPFKILSVEAPDPGIEVKVDALSSGGYRIEMKNILPFSELDGKRFIIKTDHADGREVSVPVRMTPASGQGK